jgi:hypothetical protein
MLVPDEDSAVAADGGANPYDERPPGHALEQWAKRQSALAGVVMPAGAGSVGSTAQTLAFGAGTGLTAYYLLPLTDQTFVLFAFTVALMLAVKMVREGVYAFVERWIAADNSSSWLDFILGALNWFFWVLFYAAFALVGVLVVTLFGNSTLHRVVGLLAAALVAFAVVLLIAHRGTALVFHAGDLGTTALAGQYAPAPPALPAPPARATPAPVGLRIGRGHYLDDRL